MSIEREQIFWKFLGRKMISYKRLETGQVIGTGLLNPLIDKFSIIIMLFFQSNFYKNTIVGRWKGKIVSNTFAPPIGSGPMVRALKGLVKNFLLGYSFPIAMTFAVTYRCQCKCVHCSAGKHLREDLKELNTKEAKKLIDDAQKLGVTIIAFTGGEPLLREDIYELISHVNQKKAMPVMFTNGQYLTDENVQKLADAGLYSLFVSIDSPNSQEHDNLRRMPGLFNTAIEGLKKAKSKGILVGLSSYAIRSHTERGMYIKLHEFGKKIGAQNIILFDGVPTGNMLKNTSEILTPEQREEIHLYSAEEFRKGTIPPLSSQSWQNSLEAYLAGIGCLAANIQLYATAYGEISPCDFTPLSFGNIREDSLKKIWMKMVRHPAYNHKNSVCRMQLEKFRRFYIDPIPDDVRLPYPIEKLPRVDYRKY